MLELKPKKEAYIVWVCFSLKTGLTNEDIKKKLTVMKKELERYLDGDRYVIKSCHLNREVCREKGFPADIPDIFEEVFGDAYECKVTEKTFGEAMANMDRHREELCNEADRLVLLSDDNIGNVKKELEWFTKRSVLVF